MNVGHDHEFSPTRRWPFNPQIEACTISAVLLDPEKIHTMPWLKPADFFREAHRTVWEHLLAMVDEGVPILIETLHDRLLSTHDLGRVGGVVGLGEIANSAASSVNAHVYARAVYEHATIRMILGASDAVRDDWASGIFDSTKLQQRARSALDEIEVSRSIGDESFSRLLADRFMDRVRTIRESGVPSEGIGTGLHDLDDAIHYLRPGRLYIFGGRTSMGKTALACQIGMHASLIESRITRYASLEMTSDELFDRLVAMRSSIPATRFDRTHLFSAEEWGRLEDSAAALRESPLTIDDQCETVQTIVAKAREASRKDGLDLLIVDYLQLIASENDRAPRQEQVASITRRLKRLAIELDIPVIALSQLSREVDRRKGHRPQLADLRESGAIEQNADAVILVHRPHAYDKSEPADLAELIIDKNRHGETGTIRVVWQGAFTRFANWFSIVPPPTGTEPVFDDEPFA
jgi:replicative DNA helicase